MLQASCGCVRGGKQRSSRDRGQGRGGSGGNRSKGHGKIIRSVLADVAASAACCVVLQRANFSASFAKEQRRSALYEIHAGLSLSVGKKATFSVPQHTQELHQHPYVCRMCAKRRVLPESRQIPYRKDLWIGRSVSTAPGGMGKQCRSTVVENSPLGPQRPAARAQGGREDPRERCNLATCPVRKIARESDAGTRALSSRQRQRIVSRQKEARIPRRASGNGDRRAAREGPVPVSASVSRQRTGRTHISPFPRTVTNERTGMSCLPRHFSRGHSIFDDETLRSFTTATVEVRVIQA